MSTKIDNMLVSLMRIAPNKSSLWKSCEEFKHSKSIAARTRLLQIQIGVDCLCRSRALATNDFECLNSSHDLQRLDLLETRHFPGQAGKKVRLWRAVMAHNRFKTACLLPETGGKDRQHVGKFDAHSACLHRRIWAHSVVARRWFSQLHGASCAWPCIPTPW